MNMFQRLRVGKRLALGFGLLLSLLGASTFLASHQIGGIDRKIREITGVHTKKMQLMTQLRRDNFRIEAAIRDLILAQPEARDAILERIKDIRASYKTSSQQLDALPATADAQRAREAISEAELAARQQTNIIIERATDGDEKAATALLMGSAKQLFEQRVEAIQAGVDLQTRYMEESAQQINDAVISSNRILIGFGITAALAGVLLGWLITRSLVAPLKRATDVAEAIAQGQLDNEIPPQPADETGQLLDSMRTMQQVLQSVLHATSEMAEQHDAGFISHRMNDEAFAGSYGRMVRETNALVSQHIGVKMRVVEIMRSYAVGNLSVDMDRLPGEKACITEAMDSVKANLSAINTDIKRLSNAAAAGDFSQRGDVERFQYDFHEMVAGLNHLMQTTDGNLAEVSSLLQAIARGDLTARMEGEFHGVFAHMRDDAEATTSQLASIVGRIQEATGAINNAAGEIASGNSDLSRRTEQQAANLEETAASMEELTSTVKQNADSARQANTLAIGAAQVASQGGEVVGQVVTTMEAIETSSRRISEIISVIDGIAFQTNILALNAAVEAARAGEQGRGFAVVASEVRTLAQRSANAAKEIKSLIDDSVGKVADGSALVRRAGDTMGEIVTSVQRVTDIMAEISAASQEQSAGIEQINQTITQMDGATQQNAALVEEASAAARSMEEQAKGLSEAVAVFQLEIAREPALRMQAHVLPVKMARAA